MEVKNLGCITKGGIIALVIAALAFGLSYTFNKNVMFSPGELSAQSSGNQLGGFISHIDLTQDCRLCHPAPWDSTNMADLCLDCHQDIQNQLLDIHSLHGASMSILSTVDCRACHTDHAGPKGKTITFSGENFPHDLVRFSLLAHQQTSWSRKVNCSDCHPSSYVVFNPKSCTDCHQQIDQFAINSHIIVFDANCTACHDGQESINQSFNHDLPKFSLTGKHTETICENCHAGAINLESFKDPPTACAACHQDQDAHSSFLGTLCENCHNAKDWKPALYDHAQTTFILDGGHTSIACSDCHPDPTFQGLSSACISCHQDDEPHQDQFGSDCTLCHTTTNWNEIRFDHAGPYAENCALCHQDDSPSDHYPGQCSACHTPSGWLPATFNHSVAQATDCQACHIPDKPVNHFNGQCLICHSTSRWKPSTINHTFPINHEGAQGSCDNCHIPNNYPAYTCYLCHEHSRSEVKKEHKDVSNIDNCIRCHWDGRKHDDDDDDD